MNEFNVNALDSLLDGNTTNDNQPDDDTSTNTSVEGSQPGQGDQSQDDNSDGQPTNSDTGDATEGGDPDLDSSKEAASDDEGAKQQAAQNRAFAQMRMQLSKYDKTIKELAKALGIEESDPNKLSDNLIQMAQTKLAKEQNVPVELYRELESTKEQLAIIQMQQNESLAVDKLMKVKETYGLSQDELIQFAKELDEDNISLAANPNIDAEYEYYKRNREKLEEKRIAAAVEEALKNASKADSQSSTPSKLKGKGDTGEAKIDNVSALNEFLENK